MSITQGKRDIVNAIAQTAKDAGYRVFVSESETYGFYGKDGGHIVYFQCSNGGADFSGEYTAIKADHGRFVGQGWQLSEVDGIHPAAIHGLYDEASRPPKWAIKDYPVRLKTIQDKIDMYGQSSRFREI